MSETITAPVAGAPAPAAPSAVVMLSSKVFMLGCAAVAALILIAGMYVKMPVWLLATEIFATIIGLFVFGSFKYQIHKNALTYGMAMVIIATFFGIWWPGSLTREKVAVEGVSAAWPLLRGTLLSWHGLDDLVHADTMLFILGLTFFVSVIAQTRLLETITFKLLHKNDGHVLPTVIAVTAVVAFSSGILDGVSMIGLTIRTLVIIMLLASAPTSAVRYAVMVCTVVTTVCGMWLAYGEPPNLIMKSNLTGPDGKSYLTDAFFLRYCAPAAFACYLVIAWNLRKRLKGTRVKLDELDVIDANAATVRFLQASRHGETISAYELVEHYEKEFGTELTERIEERLKHGEALGLALVKENVPEAKRKELLSRYVDGEVADSLDKHYVLDAQGDHKGALEAEKQVDELLANLAPLQSRSVSWGIAGLVVFVALLVTHAIDHRVPLFVASFTAFAISIIGIYGIPKMRQLALHEAHVEFAEYYFLFPLFLSISLLTKAHFFDQLQDLMHAGIQSLGPLVLALIQFSGCTFLSAILDNNVVADFAARGLHGLELQMLHLFAMSQIAGYAAGGCWTHIGCAQSVVAYAFIQREVDERYTPVQWIKEMTPVIIQIFVLLSLIIAAESMLLKYLE
ncbi:MAG TPA: SLC13 family permease [Planctomycetota bacterium]|nr:SLC13 family permease [Planctomycetota bacterium]